ncbi:MULTISPECIES: hypothetical protein [unclassified Rothia (in: high G+C Gram-positive bacteria)]|uniref:hypothetical protein n=1 Tax=unclassified Rothia (in: high G+C Gram-positive bacteria) TaxID=2689056 RepID=UPI001956BDEA|nr:MULTISPECIES: hypothetical protein [unclassified Rothia (in: high G+C Gram-positive bacteria)]MBM7052262.1 hypothetical protein [Rothia sp. ZJ1223]QRZ61536.1 hypothetical protein JR346_10050 [Rothia sp. ZJ932]
MIDRLQQAGATALTTDYKQTGIGSNNCAPELLEKYRFSGTAFEFGFVMAFEGVCGSVG